MPRKRGRGKRPRFLGKTPTPAQPTNIKEVKMLKEAMKALGLKVLSGTEGVSLWWEEVPVGVAFQEGKRAWARILPLGGGGVVHLEATGEDEEAAARRLAGLVAEALGLLVRA